MHAEPVHDRFARLDPSTPRTSMVTGAAGFIGSRLAQRLLAEGQTVIGVDAYTDTYDVSEKRSRTVELRRDPRYSHAEGDLVDLALDPLLDSVDTVFHLAGRPGVRPSFELRDRYWHDNVEATERLVEACRRAPSVRRLVYASSSSVHGDAPLPFRETGEPAPISPYGRSKLEAERITLAAGGHRLETVSLRYFTVYGPGQRPDMGLRRFAEAALAGQPIRLLGADAEVRIERGQDSGKGPLDVPGRPGPAGRLEDDGPAEGRLRIPHRVRGGTVAGPPLVERRQDRARERGVAHVGLRQVVT